MQYDIKEIKGAAQIQTGKKIDDSKHPIIQNLTKCDECPISWVCDKYTPKGRCHFEIMRLKASTQKGKYLSSSEQVKFLEEIEENLKRYEDVIKYDAKPQKKDLIRLINMKIQLFDVMYAKGAQLSTNIQINSGPAGLDVKKIMDNLRDKEKVVEVEKE